MSKIVIIVVFWLVFHKIFSNYHIVYLKCPVKGCVIVYYIKTLNASIEPQQFSSSRPKSIRASKFNITWKVRCLGLGI